MVNVRINRPDRQGTQFYKSYERQRRQLHTDDTFESGMSFTDAPLQEGFFKTLINFDIEDQGTLLIPRSGLRTEMLGLYPSEQELEGVEPYVFSEDTILIDGKLCGEVDRNIYRKVILGEPSEETLEETNLYKGDLYVGTVFPSGQANEYENFEEGIITNNMLTKKLNGETTFTKPTNARIHNIPLEEPSRIYRHVGTFGFGNRYFCFKHTEEESKLVQAKFDEDQGLFDFEDVEPKVITPREAVLWGYNMLEDQPYHFENFEFSGTIQLEGILPYDDNDEMLMTPKTNEEVVFKCVYGGKTTESYEFKWEWKEPVATGWNEEKEETLDLDGLPEASATFSLPVREALIRVTATKVGEDYPEKVITVGFSFDQEKHGTTANIEPKNYDMTKATGMMYWYHRLVVYGFQEDPTLLLISDMNNPGYFPYPLNADIFDEPIIHAAPILDELLVLTTTQLYLLTPDPSGMGWTKRKIQDGLDIKEWDVHLIQDVKNMIFFKSGNYYYMIVPSTKRPGDLVMAPVSRNISYFLDHFKEEVFQIIADVYNEKIQEYTVEVEDYINNLTLIHYYNFLDFEDIHNVYIFETDSGQYLNIVLLYNSVRRHWRIYIYESEEILKSFTEDVTKKGILMGVVPLNQEYEHDNTVIQETLTGVQFLRFDPTIPKDLYVPQNTVIKPAEIPEIDEDIFFRNYQFLDTGYREQDTNIKKRYREFQLKLHNISQKSLHFYSEYLIDGDKRLDFYKYKTHHNTDPNDPDYGLLTVVQELVDPSVLPGATILAENEEDTEAWTLDQSAFPDLSFWKIRCPVSGKGYSPRLRLLCFSEELYELLNIIWVFRPMYAR